MSPPTAHLLGIPRELRDKIYSYLSHKRTFKWELGTGNQPMRVAFDNAPVASVLSVHSRLYDEYRESKIFKELSVTIIKDSNCSDLNTLTYFFRIDRAFKDGLAHVRHITLIFHSPFYTPGVDFHCISYLARALSATASHLVTVRVATQEIHNYTSDNALPGILRSLTLATGSSNRTPDPPIDLGGLPLIQRGEGLQVECAWSEDQLPAYVVRSNMLDSPGEFIMHRVNKLNVYLYARDKAGSFLWEREKIFEACQPCEYSKEILACFTNEQSKRLSRMPFEMLEWKEKHGEDLKTWGTRSDKEEIVPQ